MRPEDGMMSAEGQRRNHEPKNVGGPPGGGNYAETSSCLKPPEGVQP